jgi:hypothetical protein
MGEALHLPAPTPRAASAVPRGRARHFRACLANQALTFFRLAQVEVSEVLERPISYIS